MSFLDSITSGLSTIATTVTNPFSSTSLTPRPPSTVVQPSASSFSVASNSQGSFTGAIFQSMSKLYGDNRLAVNLTLFAAAAGVGYMLYNGYNDTHIDPASRSQWSDETRQLAETQTKAARQLLYEPGTRLTQELSKAATNLHGVMSMLTQEEQQHLGARLLGSEGLMPHKSPAELLAVVKRVADGGGSATDRAIFIALMGDIGALFADTGATTGVEGRSPEQAQRLRETLTELLGGQPEPGTVTRVKETGGSKAVGPTKSDERSRPPGDKPLRTGIHNVGRTVDDKLGIHEEQRLPTSRWDVAQIQRARVNTTTEPLVGHMSGSPAEILQVWDMLCGVPSGQQFTGVLDSMTASEPTSPLRTNPMRDLGEDAQLGRGARAAGAAAFLVGLGYHSAVEVLEGTLDYTGQSVRSVVGPREDAGHLAGHDAATVLITELFDTART